MIWNCTIVTFQSCHYVLDCFALVFSTDLINARDFCSETKAKQFSENKFRASFEKQPNSNNSLIMYTLTIRMVFATYSSVLNIYCIMHDWHKLPLQTI